MDLERELRSLAEANNWDGPVVSLYLDTRWVDESQRERVRVFWQQAKQGALRDGVPEEAIRGIDAQITEVLRMGARASSVAIFASPTRFKLLWLPVRAGNACFWSDRPALAPLARAISRVERVLVAAVGAKLSHVYELVGPEIRSRIDLGRDDFPGRHTKTGFRAQHMTRHIREHIRWELDPVADALVEAFDREPCRVCVFGTPQVTAMFLSRLPQRVSRAVAVFDGLSGDPNQADREVAMRVTDWLQHLQLDEAMGMEGRIYQEAMGSGRGALGTQDVLLALQEGRIHQLMLKEGFECYGAECTRCGALDIKRTTGCQYCGGPVRAGDLVEAIVQRAIREGAQIKFVPNEPRHVGVGGIAALLRPNRGPGLHSLGRENRMEDVVVSRPS